MLRQHSQRRLGELKVVPEIVVFDYALTGYPKTLPPNEVRGATLPLLALRSYMDEQRLKWSTRPLSDFHRWGYRTNEDRFGCFSGSLTSLLFADHPCIGVPTTAYPDDEPVTGFYQWFLESAFYGAFEEKSRLNPSWPVLLAEGLPFLRERFIELVREGALVISLRDLLQLADDELSLERIPELTVKCRTRYGLRNYSVESLFFDVLYPDPTDEDLEPALKFRKQRYVYRRDEEGKVRREEDDSSMESTVLEVVDWANDCLEAPLRGNMNGGELVEAVRLAERYQQLFLRCFPERFALSQAIYELKHFKTTDLPSKITRLAKKWGLDLNAARSWDAEVATTERIIPGNTIGSVADEASSPVVARTTALFCTLWAEGFVRGVLGEEREPDGEKESAHTQIQQLWAELTDLVKRERVRSTLLQNEPPHAQVFDSLLDLDASVPENAEKIRRFVGDNRYAFRQLEREMLSAAGGRMPRYDLGSATTDVIYVILAPSPKKAAVWGHRGKTTDRCGTPALDSTYSVPPCEIRMKLTIRFTGAEIAEAISVDENVTVSLDQLADDINGRGMNLRASVEKEMRQNKWTGKYRVSVYATDVEDDLQFEISDVGDSDFGFDKQGKAEYPKQDHSGDVSTPLRRLKGNELSIEQLINPKDGKTALKPGEPYLLLFYATFIRYPDKDLPLWLTQQL